MTEEVNMELTAKQQAARARSIARNDKLAAGITITTGHCAVCERRSALGGSQQVAVLPRSFGRAPGLPHDLGNSRTFCADHLRQYWCYVVQDGVARYALAVGR